jgi:hypothetical protein
MPPLCALWSERLEKMKGQLSERFRNVGTKTPKLERTFPRPLGVCGTELSRLDESDAAAMLPMVIGQLKEWKHVVYDRDLVLGQCNCLKERIQCH